MNKKIVGILVSILSVFILCSLSYQPAAAEDCGCPHSNIEEPPVVRCIILTHILFASLIIYIPIGWITYFLWAIMPGRIIDWEEISDLLFFDVYLPFAFAIIVRMIEIGCIDVTPPKN